MHCDAPIHGQSDPTIPPSLGLCVRSLAALVKQRAHERDVARLEREVAVRERDTIRTMLSVTLGLLHMAERRYRASKRHGMYQSRRRPFLLNGADLAEPHRTSEKQPRERKTDLDVCSGT
jgi:hypothetical protein